jgi:hypothetical protein
MADGLESVLRPLPADEIARLCGGFLGDLAALLHSVASARGSAPEREPPRLRVLEGLARVLDTLASDRPVIAVLDDAHLADASSWDALRYLARHLAKARLCVVVTARTAELFHHEVAPQVLFELDQDGALTGLDVGPLERGPLSELTQELIGQHPPLALVDWLSDRSRGNALFAIGLLRALVEEGADLSALARQRGGRLAQGFIDIKADCFGRCIVFLCQQVICLAQDGEGGCVAGILALLDGGRPCSLRVNEPEDSDCA